MMRSVKIINKVLREILIAILFFAFVFSYSQTKVSGWNTSKHRVDNKTIKQINGRAERTKILNDAILFKLQNPDTLVGVHFIETLAIDIENIVLRDTFTTIADYILLDYTNSLVEPTSQAIKYALITSIGLAEIEADTIYRFQKYFKLARERGFGYANYKSIGLPFQFRDSVNIIPEQTSIKIQTFATKEHCVSYYLDNVEFDLNRSCDPGQISEIEWRHTMIYDGLQPGTEYLLRIEGNVLETGEFDFVEWRIKTLN